MHQGTRRTKQIGMLELLKLCQKYGVDTPGIRQIAAITGIGKRTVAKLIYDYCIIPNLNSGLLDD